MEGLRLRDHAPRRPRLRGNRRGIAPRWRPPTTDEQVQDARRRRASNRRPDDGWPAWTARGILWTAESLAPRRPLLSEDLICASSSPAGAGRAGLLRPRRRPEGLKMESPAFLITIDTEGDDIWGRHATVTTENVPLPPTFPGPLPEARLQTDLPDQLRNGGRSAIPGVRALGSACERRRDRPARPPLELAAPRRERPGDPGRLRLPLRNFRDDLLRAKVDSLTGILRDVFDISRRRIAPADGDSTGVSRACSSKQVISWTAPSRPTSPGRDTRAPRTVPAGRITRVFQRQPYFLDLTTSLARHIADAGSAGDDPAELSARRPQAPPRLRAPPDRQARPPIPGSALELASSDGNSTSKIHALRRGLGLR